MFNKATVGKQIRQHDLESQNRVKRMVEKMRIHKDFHGAMSWGIQYLQEKYGEEELVLYLKQLARTVYGPLSRRLKRKGLSVLEEHWRKIFTIEGGDFDLRYEGKGLVLRVHRCPAIDHLNKHNYLITDRFCEQTRIINEEICRLAGYNSSVEYDQKKGSCTQRFWRR